MTGVPGLFALALWAELWRCFLFCCRRHDKCTRYPGLFADGMLGYGGATKSLCGPPSRARLTECYARLASKLSHIMETMIDPCLYRTSLEHNGGARAWRPRNWRWVSWSSVDRRLCPSPAFLQVLDIAILMLYPTRRGPQGYSVF